MAQQDMAQVKALTFDVFGTVVDWRGSLIREGLAFGAARGIQIDWASFADDWRGGYGPSMNRVRRGELPWTNIDALHRMVLDELLMKYGITSLSEADKDYLNRVWHRLTAWSDAIPGLTRLRVTLRAGNAFEWQCRAAHQYGKICRVAVGLYSLSRVDAAL